MSSIDRRRFLARTTAATALAPLLQHAGALAQSPGPSLNAGLRLPSKYRYERVLDIYSAAANRKYVLADLQGPGCIRHMWICPSRTLGSNRTMIFRIYWDGEEHPSVEAPIGDFFGVFYGIHFYPVNSLYISVQDQNGYNCYFPMPFSKSARIEIETSPTAPGAFHYHIDWHRYPQGSLEEDTRFHAAWRREFPTQSYGEEYTILDAAGRGRLLGFAYGVRLYDSTDRWSHGGAENIYLDGETTGEGGVTPNFIRGTGGEDTFGTSYGGAIHKPETQLYVGMPYYVHEDFGGGARPSQRIAAYRFYEHDAISFDRSVHFRFGCMSNDICSTAYWYQTEPHRPFVKMPPWAKWVPGTELKRGETDLLEQTGATGPGAVLADAEDGEWWLCGAFENESGQAMARLLPPEEGSQPDPSARYDGGFTEKSPWRNTRSQRPDQHMARWIRRRAFHGFIDFAHVFRPWFHPGTGVCWPAAACAVTTLHAPRDTAAKLYLTWDDRAIVRLNNDAPIDGGNHTDFRQRSFDVKLKRGENRLVLKLSNTRGTTWGTWCFAFKAVLSDGKTLIPRVAS